MRKKIAIIQSNYIPWKGYFDIINMVDEFIVFDQMQYTRRDWRNRNKIKTSDGVQWLTIPVDVKGKFHQRIMDTCVKEAEWAERHWKTIKHQYSRAVCFAEYENVFNELYLQAGKTCLLSEINLMFINVICDILGIKTVISHDYEYICSGDQSERLLNLVLQAEGNVYLSGPSAKDYLDEKIFIDKGIKIEWMDYSNYPVYDQLYGEFVHEVSIIDLIFNQGAKAVSFMKSFDNG